MTRTTSPSLPAHSARSAPAQTPAQTLAQTPALAPVPIQPSLGAALRKRYAAIQTPQGLRFGLTLICGLTGLSLLQGLGPIHSQREAFKTLSQDAAPGILTPARIRDSLAALDASLANELLLPPGQNPEATQAIQERQRKLAGYLVSLAGTRSNDNQDRRLISILQTDFGNYLMASQRARDWNAQARPDKKLQAYQQAAAILDRRLLPAAQELGFLKRKSFEQSATEQRHRTQAHLIGLTLTGLALLGCLLALQLYLSQRTRRTLNPALLGASAIALLSWGHLLGTIASSFHDLSEIQTQTFQQLILLRETRTLIYSAHADVSRSLLDTQAATQHDRSFQQKFSQLIDQSEGQLTEQITQYKPLAERIQLLSLQASTPSQRNQAIALSTGYQSNQLNGVLESLLDRHQTLVEANTATFDQGIGKGTAQLEGLDWQMSLGVGLVAVLTIVGIWPRLREFDR